MIRGPAPILSLSYHKKVERDHIIVFPSFEVSVSEAYDPPRLFDILEMRLRFARLDPGSQTMPHLQHLGQTTAGNIPKLFFDFLQSEPKGTVKIKLGGFRCSFKN